MVSVPPEFRAKIEAALPHMSHLQILRDHAPIEVGPPLKGCKCGWDSADFAMHIRHVMAEREERDADAVEWLLLMVQPVLFEHFTHIQHGTRTTCGCPYQDRESE